MVSNGEVEKDFVEIKAKTLPYEEFKKKLVANPKSALKEIGVLTPEDMALRAFNARKVWKG